MYFLLNMVIFHCYVRLPEGIFRGSHVTMGTHKPGEFPTLRASPLYSESSRPVDDQIEPRKNPGWLGYIGDEILPNYIGIIINHYKDPH